MKKNLRKTLLMFMLICNCYSAIAAPSKVLWKHWLPFDSKSSKHINHHAWDAFLKKNLRKNKEGVNLIPYGNISVKDKAVLTAYLTRLSKINIKHYNRNAQAAYWINLYNALTVQTVIQHYPVKSSRDIDISPGLFSSGPWEAKLIKVAGVPLSLNDIEHRILRPIWNDPRFHYALNCASISCPILQKQAFTQDNLQNLLNQSARGYINSRYGLAIKRGRLKTSKIYQWYKNDFGGTDLNVIAHLKRYATPALLKQLSDIKRISGSYYDWALNDAIIK